MAKRKRGNAPKRRTRRKAKFTGRKRIVSMPRAMRPRSYFFNRSFVETVTLNSTTPPTGWTAVDNGLVRSQPFMLSQLDNYTEFVNMFAQYRLLAVSQEYFFSNTNSDNLANQQLIMYTVPNAQGVANTANLDESFFMQSQCSKKRLCLTTTGRPVKVYTKMKQLSRIYSGELGNQDFIKVKPKFVSTTEPQAQHYGIDVRLQRIDGEEFSHGGTTYPVVKIVSKVYLQTRQVK